MSVGHVVALSQCEVRCITWTGSDRWQVNTDVIVEHERSGNTLRVTCDDGSRVIIDLRNGSTL